MKRLIKLIGVAVVSTLVAVSYTHALTLTTSPTTDLMLVFHPTTGMGAGTDYYVDLGNFNAFLTQAPGTTVSLTGSSGIQIFDLASEYGAATTGAASTTSWDNRTAASVIDWAVVGATGTLIVNGQPKFSLFGSSAFNQSGLGAGIPSNTQSTPAGAIDTWIQSLGGDTVTGDATVNGANGSTNAVYDPTQSFGTASSGSSPFFGAFNDPPFNNTTNVANGSVFSQLYEFKQGATPTVVNLGFFTLSSTGFTFTAIPEPSTYQMLALGALGLGGLMVLRRRRVHRA